MFSTQRARVLTVEEEAMEFSERKRKILKAIVESYVESAEPVGSKAIAESSELNLSSATIRNEMAELTAMGLLEQPHTSAGRVPSHQGYRIYVNELMNEHRLSLEETREINKALKSKVSRLDELLSDAGKVISELTNYPAYAVAAPAQAVRIKRFECVYVDANTVIAVAMLDNNTVKNRIMSFPVGLEEDFVKKLAAVFNANFTGITGDEMSAELISAAEKSTGDSCGAVAALASFAISALAPETVRRTYLAGAPQLLTLPEYRDVDKAHRLLNYLTEETALEKVPDAGENGVKILIGAENVAEELKDAGVVLASYDLGNNMQGVIGVVGPTRMDYAKVAAYLSYIAKEMKQAAKGGEIPRLLEHPAEERNDEQ
jgi:heat-inducible transcriptional repressor